MCGIFGLFGDHAERLAPEKIYRSFSTLKSRGPDRTLIVHNRYCFIGFHRLAIMGLDIEGDQPFHSIDGVKSFYLVCNGEIYNFRELIDQYNLDVSKTGSDCAVILPLFHLFDFDIDRLNRELIGEYSFSIIELDNHILQRVWLCTDPLSVRPVFFGVTDDGMSFGFSSLLSGLSDLFPSVHRFEQKSILVWSQGQQPSIRKYWPEVSNMETSNEEESARDYQQAVEVLEKAVQRRLQSDRALGCLLSGGLDSSLVCAIAARKMADDYPGKKLYAFSIGMREGTDLDFARMVAEHVQSQFGNLSHHIIHFTPEEGLHVIDEVIRATETWDITTIRASVGQYLIGKHISEETDVRVLLNGDGADEEQMGYLYFYLSPTLPDAQKEHYRLLDEIHLFDGLRVDRAISCHGLEARVPFLDREVVDYFRALPSSWKLPTKERMEKHFIRTAFDRIYKENPVLPHEILWRKKEAFSDGVSSKEKSWFEIIQEYFNEKVTDEEFNRDKGKLHPDIVPPSKEAFYYMKRFREIFGEQWQTIPHYWLPKWSGNIQEPSARVLKVYKSS